MSSENGYEKFVVKCVNCSSLLNSLQVPFTTMTYTTEKRRYVAMTCPECKHYHKYRVNLVQVRCSGAARWDFPKALNGRPHDVEAPVKWMIPWTQDELDTVEEENN